ncbi:MAG: amino acid ABC transporter permease [Defluviitaleaceae bacterium]|nr:amino acid ABC transporter permease [Defluviitaleaceae bacterium]
MFNILLATAPPPGWEEGLLRDIWANLIQGDRWRLLLEGLGITFQVTIGALMIGITLGVLSALMRLSKIAPLRWLSLVYITIVRGVPMPVQLMIWWFVFFAPTGEIPRLIAAVIAFGINSGAYSCEIYRSAIQSVDYGQTEAGRSLGLNKFQNFRLIIVPQALKNCIGPVGNEFITLFKYTSIVGLIGLQDLTRAADLIRSRTFSPLVPMFTIAIIYLGIVILLTWLLSLLERRLRKSDSR